MQIQDVFRYYEEDLKHVERCMNQNLISEVDLIPEIILHLLESGGKRFRPLLLLATSDLCGYRGERRYPMSAMIEFIHTATLLHDDVVDSAETRRGKVSANNIWGNAASILVGDFLVSRSFRLLTEDGDLAIMRLLSTTTSTMAEGELFQMARSGDIAFTEGEYLSIIERKTATLIAAACAVGAMLANVPSRRIEALSRFGMKIGSAFQITDDTLDYVAQVNEFGKAIGKDLEEGKLTLPLIHALRLSSAAERERVAEAVLARGRKEKALEDVMAVIHSHGGIGYALDRARMYVEEGKIILDDFDESDAKAALLAISDYVLERRT